MSSHGAIASEPRGSFDVMDPRCPSRTVLRHVTGRWTPLIVTSLNDGPLRFTELRGRVGGVTPKVLTQTLRSMERDGFVVRHVTGTVPPRVDYELTAVGRSLTEPIRALRTWAEEHAVAVLESRAAHDSTIQV
ncbi:helix-turn-helix transcriptional regulator [Rothia sp. p3-SID1597]|nr:helix-turn-helix transcriptional regulator [Rothia sp. p3-SID1597]